MVTVPDNLCKLNYPIKTDLQKKFWGSSHRCNKMKSIIAFSLTLENANDNLRRAGHTLQWRKKAIRAFAEYVNNPSLKDVPYSETSTPWWECMPVHTGDSLIRTKWFINFKQDTDVCAEVNPWYGPSGSTVKFSIVWSGPCQEDSPHLQYIARGDSDNETFIAIDSNGRLAYHGFDMIQGSPIALLDREVEYEFRANTNTELRHFGSFGSHHPRYTLNGYLYNLELKNGSDDRTYPMSIVSKRQPTTTHIEELGGNNGNIIGNHTGLKLWTNHYTFKEWLDEALWDDNEDWVEILKTVDSYMISRNIKN